MRRSLCLGALLVVALCCGAAPVLADTPANCTYADMLGYWDVYLSEPGNKNTDCYNTPSDRMQPGIKFLEPNLAASDVGERGNWTLIYNQGMELWLHDKIYTFLFEWEGGECDRSHVGWLHDQSGRNWYCLRMQRATQRQEPKVPRGSSIESDASRSLIRPSAREPLASREPERLFQTNHAYLAAVNAAQDYFTVGHYPEFERMTLGEMQRMSGAPISHDMREVLPPFQRSEGQAGGESLRRRHVGSIPDSFDWRNVSGVNYVTPVVSQGSCGSCYSFAAVAMLEARIRIRSNMTQQPFLSNQDVVSCSPYSQGCNGGFPYLVAGKYGRDYGFTEEACFPYKAADLECKPNPQPSCNPRRWYTAEYYYVGGYYGMTTEQLIKEEVLANGPVATSFMVLPDFRNYKSGVYTHRATAHLDNEFDPFHLTNHVVVIVGWGETPEGIKYWSVKNSWGREWGEAGYFRILRGAPNGGEVSIESLVPSAIPILH